MLDLGLRGKRALLAGAGQGMGRACALGLAEAGARIVCLDVDEAAALVVAEQVHAQGGECHARAVDVRSRAAVNSAVADAAETLGGIDVVIDIIGENWWNWVLDLTDDDWADSFDLVLRHFFYLVQAAAPRMIAQGTGGAFVSVSSISGFFAAPRHAAYGAAKAGMNAFIKTACVELGADGIRLNAVAPGSIRTPRVIAMLGDSGMSRSQDHIPMGRMGEPEDIARVALFLASDLAGYVTGQTILCDGGAAAQFPLSLPSRPTGD